MVHPQQSRKESRTWSLVVSLLVSIVLAGGAGVTWHFYYQNERLVNSLYLLEAKMSGVEAGQIALQVQMNNLYSLTQQLIQPPTR